MSPTVSREELTDLVGRELEPSAWLLVDQARIDRFADATDDHQYIHTDPQRASRTRFGTTIAHGFLTLSLLPRLSAETAPVPEGTRMAVNYGLNKVRFVNPVLVGSRVRLRAKVLDVRGKGQGRVLVRTEARVEIEGRKRPALIAETLILFLYGGPQGRGI